MCIRDRYRTEDDNVTVSALIKDETIWLTPVSYTHLAFHTRGRPHALSYLPGISAPLLHAPYSDPCLHRVPAASAAAKADLPAPGVFPVPPDVYKRQAKYIAFSISL